MYTLRIKGGGKKSVKHFEKDADLQTALKGLKKENYQLFAGVYSWKINAQEWEQPFMQNLLISL